MPKESITLNAFEGGVNLRDDPRDIGGDNDNELAIATGCDLSHIGRILTQVSGQASSGACGTLGNQAGYGLFSFSADYNNAGSSADTDYYLVGGASGTVDVVTSAFAAAANLDLSIGSSDTDNRYAFFVADGGVRCSDGNFGNVHADNKVVHVKYVINDCIGELGTTGSWVSSDAGLSPPQYVTVNAARDSTPDNNIVEVHFIAAGADDAAIGWGKDPDADVNDGDCSASADANFSTIVWMIGASFVYDDDQETTITEANYTNAAGAYYDTGAVEAGTLRFSTRQKFKVGMTLKTDAADSLSTNPGHERITAVKVYMKKAASGSSWFLIMECDLKTSGGGRNPFDDDYNEWSASAYGAVTNGFETNTNAKLQPPQAVTFRSETGYDADSGLTYEARFRTACAVNRRAYIGNVYQAGKQFGDRLLKTGPNQFDIYPEGNWIDVVINDGDYVTTMVVYADRIFQFKRRNLYLLNVAEDTEFLEGQYLNYGVMHPSQVCVCSYGVLWVNEHGCYRYDGESVIDLIAEKIPQESLAITESSSSIPGISYSEDLRKLFICHNLNEAGSGYTGTGGWSFDFVNEGWTRLGSGFWATGKKSNLHIDFAGDICYVIGSTLYKVGTAPSDTGLEVKTKDIIFGDPGQRVKVYRVRISYKGNASGLYAYYHSNGDDDPLRFEGTDATTGLPTGVEAVQPLHDKTDTTVWHHAELKPATTSEATNIYSMSLLLTGDVDADFEVNDISVIYRKKTVK